MAAYWEIAAQSAYDMFSKFKYLIVDLVLTTSVFGVENSLLLRLFLIIAYLYLFMDGTDIDLRRVFFCLFFIRAIDV